MTSKTKTTEQQEEQGQAFNAPVVFDAAQARTAALILDQQAMASIEHFATLMSSGTMTVPKHLKSKADCMAITMQAMQWQLNPFVVAQKTFEIGGKLGYEAQLVNAVAMSCGALKTAPDFEFIGDWSKVLGKFKIMPGKEGGKPYAASAWQDSDEAGLGVKVTAVLRGETTPRELTLMLVQCFPRFSTQWATDPQQQITYTAVRKFIRRYAPGALLGVYTPDELTNEFEYAPGAYVLEKAQMQEQRTASSESPQSRTATPTTTEQKTLEVYSDERFKRNIAKFQSYIDTGIPNDEVISTVKTMYILSDEQVSILKQLRPRTDVQKM